MPLEELEVVEVATDMIFGCAYASQRKWLKKMKSGEEIHLAGDIRWSRGRLVYGREVEVKRVSSKVKNSKSLTHNTIPVKALAQDVHPQTIVAETSSQTLAPRCAPTKPKWVKLPLPWQDTAAGE